MDVAELLPNLSPASLLEALMLVCFGIAWPVATLRMLVRRRAEGQGRAFTAIILCGYAAGASAKLAAAAGIDLDAVEPVFWLYVINLASVAINLALQWHYRRRPPRPDAAAAPAPMPSAR
ncbi:hypothetical protein [Piscinibacter koreensis]|uniref:PQ loop repeat protein n=1 Tax=Piscinibacter koreensis TaxID=2742824 RepID=A0A7Y6NL82_9BURK|nr:hypothetical protein [Schlegelella koreensis]NUZ05275.1 hypothetical protein [Schlegelella koreensis]